MGRKLVDSWSFLVVSAAFAGGCSGSGSDDLSGSRDAAVGESDASAEVDAGTCPSSDAVGTIEIEVRLPDGVLGDVRIVDSEGEQVGSVVTASGSRSVPTGAYTIEAHRVREPGELVGAAFQPAIALGASVCVRADRGTDARVTYTREPGSARMWLTQSNGSGAQVMAFDPGQLAELGSQTPSVGLRSELPAIGPLRVDALGRLWVGSSTGVLSGYATARLGESASDEADITLSGAALCEEAIPCGPRALAFDAEGALYVATLRRIVKLEPASLARTGEPAAALTITSPDMEGPRALALDANGNLWVGDASGAVLRFDAERLVDDIADESADAVIYVGSGGPVFSTFGSPEGLAFDTNGHLWVGYFAGNQLALLSRLQQLESTSASTPLITTTITIGTEALITDLAIDEAGNLWLPGGQGAVYTIASDELLSADPAIQTLRSPEIGSVERLTFNTVPGPTFIAP